jgi:hypothetical protein
MFCHLQRKLPIKGESGQVSISLRILWVAPPLGGGTETPLLLLQLSPPLEPGGKLREVSAG